MGKYVTGYCEREMDDKGRVLISKACSMRIFYLIPVKEWTTLFIYPECWYDKISEDMIKLSESDPVRKRFFSAVEVKAEKVGRIVIPKLIRDMLDFSQGSFTFSAEGDCMAMEKKK